MNRWVLLASALFAAVVVAVDDSSTTTTVPNAEEALATIGSFLKTTEAPQQVCIYFSTNYKVTRYEK